MKRILIFLRNKFIIFINKIVYFFYRFLPINDKLILFESEGDYCDNAWALYQHLKKKHKYKFVWFVSQPDKFQNTEDTVFKNRFKLKRWDVYRYYATAFINFYTHWTIREIKPRKGQTVVHLFHAVPVKAGKNSTYDFFHYVLTTGHAAIPVVAKFMQCSEQKVLPLGFPRNDLLLENNNSGHENQLFRNLNFKKLVLWMPTFRASTNKDISENSVDTETGLPLFSTEDQLNSFNDYLKKTSIILLVKIHHLQANKNVFKKEFSNIIVLKDSDIQEKGLQNYQVIGNTDALITDYSSISIDYSLLDKPMCFTLDDFEEYKKSRGFAFDNLDDIFAGHLAYTQQDLYNFLNDLLYDKDEYKKKREKLRMMMHINDGKSACCRICDFFNL